MDMILVTVALVVGSIGILGLKKYFKGGVFKSSARLDGKVVVITGANTGIGKETAIELAKRGARIIMACRDFMRAEATAKEIRLLAKVVPSKVTVEVVDLASLKTVREFAERISAKEKQIDVLINNAGVMWTPYTKTIDGNEMQLQVNHLGHFLLTNLLLDKLKAAPKARIVTVSSIAHDHGVINLEDLNSEKSYGRDAAYAQSKLANILFTKSLAKRLKGTSVTTYCLHPGIVATELGRYSPILSNKIVFKVLRVFLWPFFKTSTEGAQTSIFCAVEPSIANDTGKYYSDCAEKTPAGPALGDEVAEKLWDASEKLVGLKS